ncbi:uncharacterized protein UV8b_02205 [Ustilaginoidea virens]|uniref:Uncharacterized protein n=1 Tax=Ustilaginoidea virens TaxID=1159556 RepID=A0A8E5HM77_USTVR|nr:uncharacterized protein UV8b_02205 [Ustilaginoidea virens]QUC17964.1 hypothetical protein UV8b_02205 [Ustilaginoidea virens]
MSELLRTRYQTATALFRRPRDCKVMTSSQQRQRANQGRGPGLGPTTHHPPPGATRRHKFPPVGLRHPCAPVARCPANHAIDELLNKHLPAWKRSI